MRRRQFLATLVVILLLSSGCSIRETIGHPSCTGGNNNSAFIVAQSVPTATLLPCFGDLPAGWEVQTVDINQTGTTVVIDSDRAGFSAARFRFLSDCDVGSAIATPSDFARTERFEDVHEVSPRFQADRYYRFEGGCVWWHFEFDVGIPSAMSVELGNSLQLLDRKEVNDNFRESFVDEDL